MAAGVTRFAIALTLFAGAVAPADGVTIDWLTVGDAGNAADTTGYGAVPYEYQIGKYDVTAEQYADNLNAVARADTYSLHETSTAANPNIGGICGVPAFSPRFSELRSSTSPISLPTVSAPKECLR